MTKDELVVWAEARGSPQSAYALDGGHPSETLVLDQRGPLWVVYYSERGLERDLYAFGQELEALSYFRARLEEIVPIAGDRDAR